MKIVECSILKSCELVCTYFGLMRVHPFGGTMSLKVFDVQRKCVFRIHDMCDKFLLIIYYVIYIIYYNIIYIYIYICLGVLPTYPVSYCLSHGLSLQQVLWSNLAIGHQLLK